MSADGNCRRHLRNVLLLTLTLDGAVLCALALLVPPILLCAAVPVPRLFPFIVKIGARRGEMRDRRSGPCGTGTVAQRVEWHNFCSNCQFNLTHCFLLPHNIRLTRFFGIISLNQIPKEFISSFFKTCIVAL